MSRNSEFACDKNRCTMKCQTRNCVNLFSPLNQINHQLFRFIEITRFPIMMLQGQVNPNAWPATRHVEFSSSSVTF